MTTLLKLLEHPALRAVRIVAGHEGLARRVTWVHTTGVPDAPNWLNGNELVFATGINLPDTDEQRRAYIREMAQKEVAGLIVSVGRYIDAVPEVLCTVADAYAFPLMEIPYTERFVEIARTINEQFSQVSLQMVQRALHIHQTLTELVLDGGGLQHLATQLADLVGHSISIENERFESIAACNITDVDEARRYTLLHGRTDPRLIRSLEERGILPEIRRTLRPVSLPTYPDVGLEMERVLAPIVVHGEIYGYMWIIADELGLNDIDFMAIESGSTIAALMLLHQESVQSAEASLKGSLLSQLMQGNASRETILMDQSMRFGIDLRAPYTVLITETTLPHTQHIHRIYRVVNQLLTTNEQAAVTGQFAGQIVVLAQVTEGLADMRSFAAAIQQRIHATELTEGRPRVGISGVQQGIHRVRDAYEQAQDALLMHARLRPDETVVAFDDLGYLHTLFQAGPGALRKNPHVPLLRRLEEEKQVDLFRTLEAYLDAGGNGVSTAEQLHIHRSTLNYRLTRIMQICDVDLQDPRTRTNLQVALKLMRLFPEVAPEK